MAEKLNSVPLPDLALRYKEQHAQMLTQLTDCAAQTLGHWMAPALGAVDHMQVFLGAVARPNLLLHVSVPWLNVPHLNEVRVTKDIFDAMDKIQALNPDYINATYKQYGEVARTMLDFVRVLELGVKSGHPAFTEYSKLLPKYIALEHLAGTSNVIPFVEYGTGKRGDVTTLGISSENPNLFLAKAKGHHAVIRPGIHGFGHLLGAYELIQGLEPDAHVTVIENDGLSTETLLEFAKLLGHPHINVLKDDPQTTQALQSVNSVTVYLLGDLPLTDVHEILANAGRSLAVRGNIFYKDKTEDNPELQNTAISALSRYLRIVWPRDYMMPTNPTISLLASKYPVMPPGDKTKPEIVLSA